MPYKILKSEQTPNPNAMKFTLDRPITDRPVSDRTPADADNPLLKQLLAIPGVVGVLVLNDFITVTRTPDAKWPFVKSQTVQILKNT